MTALILLRRPNGERAAILDDLLEWSDRGYQDAIDQAVIMLAELRLRGKDSSHAKKLQGLPI